MKWSPKARHKDEVGDLRTAGAHRAELFERTASRMPFEGAGAEMTDAQPPPGLGSDWASEGSSCWTRTSDPAVNSRLLYQLS